MGRVAGIQAFVIQTGPRGGRFYFNAAGRRVYGPLPAPGTGGRPRATVSAPAANRLTDKAANRIAARVGANITAQMNQRDAQVRARDSIAPPTQRRTPIQEAQLRQDAVKQEHAARAAKELINHLKAKGVYVDGANGPRTEVADFLVKAFGHRMPSARGLSEIWSSPSHSSKIESISIASHEGSVDGNRKLKIRSTLYNSAGQKAGKIERSFYFKDGKLGVYHDWFELKAEERGGGTAKAIMRKSFAAYERFGVKEVTVTAGLQSGRFVWAHMGWSWASKSQQKEMQDAYYRFLQNHHATRSLPIRTLRAHAEKHTLQPYVLVDSKINGRSLGEEFLKSGDRWCPIWSGRMPIDPQDAGFQRLKRITNE